MVAQEKLWLLDGCFGGYLEEKKRERFKILSKPFKFFLCVFLQLCLYLIIGIAYVVLKSFVCCVIQDESFL